MGGKNKYVLNQIKRSIRNEIYSIKTISQVLITFNERIQFEIEILIIR